MDCPPGRRLTSGGGGGGGPPEGGLAAASGVCAVMPDMNDRCMSVAHRIHMLTLISQCGCRIAGRTEQIVTAWESHVRKHCRRQRCPQALRRSRSQRCVQQGVAADYLSALTSFEGIHPACRCKHCESSGSHCICAPVLGTNVGAADDMPRLWLPCVPRPAEPIDDCDSEWPCAPVEHQQNLIQLCSAMCGKPSI